MSKISKSNLKLELSSRTTGNISIQSWHQKFQAFVPFKPVIAANILNCGLSTFTIIDILIGSQPTARRFIIIQKTTQNVASIFF